MDSKGYIGPKEVVSAEALPEKLSQGEVELTKVTYSDETSEVMTTKCYNISVSVDALDLTQLRDRRVTAICREILNMLLSYGLKAEDFQFLIASLNNSVSNAISNAVSKLWGKDENTIDFIDIFRVLEKTTLKDILHGQ